MNGGAAHPLQLYYEYLSYLFRRPPLPQGQEEMEIGYRDYLQVSCLKALAGVPRLHRMLKRDSLPCLVTSCVCDDPDPDPDLHATLDLSGSSRTYQHAMECAANTVWAA